MDQLQAIAAASEPAALPAGQPAAVPGMPAEAIIIFESGQTVPQSDSLATAAAADQGDDAAKAH